MLKKEKKYKDERPISLFVCNACTARQEIYLPTSVVYPCLQCKIGFLWLQGNCSPIVLRKKIVKPKILRYFRGEIISVVCIYCGEQQEAFSKNNKTCFDCKKEMNRARALHTQNSSGDNLSPVAGNLSTYPHFTR